MTTNSSSRMDSLSQTLVCLDIETECALNCQGRCEHALDSHRNRITVVGLVYEKDGELRCECFRDLALLRSRLDSLGDYSLVGHNLKFDLRTLAVKGLDLRSKFGADTQLMASVLTTKVSDEYLRWYSEERARRNKLLPKGYSHRPGSLHSLKVLAPYFLGVPAFWEDPTNHDSDEYVLKDVEYTYRLFHKLKALLIEERSYDFYNDRLLPWTRMLLDCELQGIQVDLEEMEKADLDAKKESEEAALKLRELWAQAYRAYEKLEYAAIKNKYDAMADKAIQKLKNPTPERIQKVRTRYVQLAFDAAIKVDPLNLDSPTQLTWLLKEHLGLDIEDFDGEETTGKAVLARLAGEGRNDIETFLTYRKKRKLTTAFFPSYREKNVNGIIHCSFNPGGARTGRLSSSNPNLQQIERNLKRLFVARPGYKLAAYDMAAIEPALIAYYTSDLNLFDIVSRGQDFHGYNTKIFFDLQCEPGEVKKKYALEREVGKEVGLSLLYGAGINRLMESAQKRGFVWGPKEARYKLDRFKEFYEGVYRFRQEVLNPVLQSGQIVTNLLGRPFRIDDPMDVHLQGLNTLIQGGASDLVLESGRRMQVNFEASQLDARPLVFEHDCIVTEFREDLEAQVLPIIENCMTTYKLVCDLGPIPLKVDGKVSKCWEK
jgi:DNA polymerase I-like protein with 3'-5' exonuclease and polymerase domains